MCHQIPIEHKADESRIKEDAMNQKMKILLAIFVVLYVVSPVDAMPGPIDDLILILLNIGAQRRMQLSE